MCQGHALDRVTRRGRSGFYERKWGRRGRKILPGRFQRERLYFVAVNFFTHSGQFVVQAVVRATLGFLCGYRLTDY